MTYFQAPLYNLDVAPDNCIFPIVSIIPGVMAIMAIMAILAIMCPIMTIYDTTDATRTTQSSNDTKLFVQKCPDIAPGWRMFDWFYLMASPLLSIFNEPAI